MDIKQIEYFVAIVDTGSFSQAAVELYISQSSLSKQIISLEKELELKLFDRTKRRISLTDAGKIFHKHALKIKNSYRDMSVEMDELRKAIPTLSVASIPVTAPYGITSLVAQFKQAHPQINFNLEERQASTIIPGLSQHRYNLAFLRDYNLDTKLFECTPIVRDKLLLAVSANHRLAKRKSVSLSELADENFIMFNKGTLIHELSINACKSAGFEPKIFYSTLRAASIIDMVSSNSGVALMMEKVLDFYRRTDVVAIPLEKNIGSKIMLVHLKKGKLSKEARIFLDFMKQKMN